MKPTKKQSVKAQVTLDIFAHNNVILGKNIT